MKQRFHSSDKYVFRGLYVYPCPKEPDILARKTKEKMGGQTKSLWTTQHHGGSHHPALGWGAGTRHILNESRPLG